jgi:hypothetical protein
MTVDNPLSAGWRDYPRYPDPAIETLDERFAQYRIFSAAVERLYTGCRWSEGPVWFGDGRYLLWSDIPNNRMLKWEEETGSVTTYRGPSDFGNGNTRDRQGRLVTCEHGGRRVTRTEYDGSVTVLMDSWQGKRLNSPNDVVVKSDGSVWFTDPPFGILGNYEGHKAEPELPRMPRPSCPTCCWSHCSPLTGPATGSVGAPGFMTGPWPRFAPNGQSSRSASRSRSRRLTLSLMARMTSRLTGSSPSPGQSVSGTGHENPFLRRYRGAVGARRGDRAGAAIAR